jgi:hypothetical protein
MQTFTPILFIVLLVAIKLANSINGWSSLDLGQSNACLMIPDIKIWPYTRDQKDPSNLGFPGTPENARLACNQRSLPLATINNYANESLAILRWKACSKSLRISMILVAYDQMNEYNNKIATNGSLCYYQQFQDGNLTTSDKADCLESYIPPSGKLLQVLYHTVRQ